MENVQKILGRRIQSLRKRYRLTQLQLAEKANLSLKHLGEIERGRGNPTLDSLNALADALSVSLSELFDLETVMPLGENAELSITNALKATSQRERSKILKIIRIILG
jgi:transcriptional regulator with XRE-family HTH domain